MSFYTDSVGSTLGEERRRYLRLTFGTASIASQSGALISAVRTGVGAYTVTLSRGYSDLVFVDATWLSRSGAQLFPRVTSRANLPTQSTFNLSIVDTAGAATEPANGDILVLEVVTNETTAGGP